MSDHINIITQEAITQGLLWPVIAAGCVLILFILVSLIYFLIKHNERYMCNALVYGTFIGIPLLLVTMLICGTFFPVETGKYKYSGTLSDEMSVAEFGEFNETFTNIRYEDGIWYWEDK